MADELNIKKLFRDITIGLVILLFIIGVIRSIRIIQPGFVGIPVMFGTVYKPMEAGFHVINPLKSVVSCPIRTLAYTMSIATDEGQVKGDDSIDVLTSDGLKMKLDVTVWYSVIPTTADELYKNIGRNFIDVIVRPSIRTSLRETAAQYSATELYATKRADYIRDINSSIEKRLGAKYLKMDEVLLRNVILPDVVTEAIGKKLAADQAQQAMTFTIEKEKKEADRRRIEAAGIRDANQIISDGLSERYLQWYYIDMMKSLAGSPNNTFIFSPTDQKLYPFIPMEKGMGVK